MRESLKLILPYGKAFSLLLAAAIMLQPRPAGAAFALYTADSARNTILKMNTNGVATVFATNGVNGLLDQPGGLVLDNLGNLYVANLAASHVANRTIEKYDPLGNGSLFASNGNVNFYGLAMDVSNHVYAATYGGGTILKFTNPGGLSSVFASAAVGEPLTQAFDKTGNLFVSDFYGSHIYKVDRLGNISLFATAPASSNPAGLAFDAAGNLYVALYSSGVIMRYDTNANATTFATLAYPNNTPYGLAFDSADNLYVSSISGSPMIFKFDPLGNRTVFASTSTGLTGAGHLVIQETRFQDNWFKAAGGGSTSTNGEFVINGTTGQQDAGTAMTGGQYGMVGGFWARISVVPTPGAPTLSITITTTNTAMVFWPSSSTGWNLQQNTDLTTTNWVASPAPTDNGMIKYIIVNPPTGNLFFRLEQ